MAKTNDNELPILLKSTLVIIGLIGLFYILFIGKSIILPFIFGLLLAMLVNPVVNFLVNHKINRVVAIMLTVLATMLVFFALMYFIASQMAMFQESFPQIKQRFMELYGDAINWVSDKFNVSEKQIEGKINSSKESMMDKGSGIIGQTFLSLGSLLSYFFLIPVYVFMFLFYKPLLLDFISRLFESARHSTVVDVLNESKTLIQSYLVGLMVEAGIVAALDISALLILGIQYAVLLGVLAALLNLIPYIGGLVAIMLPILIVLATKSPIYILYVIIAYLVVQFIDNNLIMPKIVGSRVKVNALVSIMAVFVGGALWGVPGMFLSLPITAIIKVIFDRIEGLQAWGFLLGDNMPAIGSSFFKIGKGKKTASKKAAAE